MDFEVYNPLDEQNLGASVAEALLERDPIPLADLPRFDGAGIYAIYYTGNFTAYESIAQRNRENRFEWPIYIGKAVPSGARKGGGRAKSGAGTALFKRLTDHRKTIEAATNLDINDFHVRALVVIDIWIPLGESLLIAEFAPVWNTIVEGFGNHTPGAGRFKGMRPRWDVVHPGREWAAKCAERPETADQITEEVRSYSRAASVPSKPKLMLDD